jgi:hypothetical protein
LRRHGSFDCLHGGDGGRFGPGFELGFGGGGLLFALHHPFQQDSDGAFALRSFAYFGAWREDTQVGVGGDLFDHFYGFRPVVAMGGGFGYVEAGDLEAVEEQAGAAGVDVVGGDTLEDLSDGVLDC